MKYEVLIEEVVADKFVVEAENEESALEIAKNQYKKAEFVLCPGELQCKKIAIVKENSDALVWNEF